MENTALILISIALLILVIIMALLTLLVYKLFNQNRLQTTTNEHGKVAKTAKSDVSQSQFHPAILERMKQLETVKTKSRLDLFCPNHPEEPGEVTCAICDKLYCRVCIRPYKTMHFCKEHLPFIMKNNWEEILTVKTSTTDPEKGVRLFEVKKKLFDEEEVMTYVETHYKINVDQDYIETYLVLFGISEKLEEAKKRFLDFEIDPNQK